MANETSNKNISGIKLRAHHILCFHGYSGRGYDDTFIENMNYLKELFLSKPETLIEIISSPDVVCDACPNLSDNGCFEDGNSDQEMRIHNRDLAVMNHLGISEEDVFSVGDIFKRAEADISSYLLREICHDCSWLPISSCAKNIEIGFWGK